MKKLLLSLFLVPILGISQTNVYNYGFSGVTADLYAAGWVGTNQSVLPVTTRLWSIAGFTAVTATATSQNAFNAAPVAVGATSPIPVGQSGGNNSFTLVNYACTSSTAATGATISNWLISPLISVKNGDVVSFYTRIGKNTIANNASFADNLELRMSTNGDFTNNPATGSTDVGDFTNLLVAVNPNLDLTSYPSTWTKYSYTVTGVDGVVPAKFALRYYVTDGGSAGANSDIIGVDTFSVDRPALATENFVASNFSVFPNPATNVVNINSLNNTTINQIQITDLNGRVVSTVNANGLSTTQVNIADLASGAYFLKIVTNEGVGTTKIIKK